MDTASRPAPAASGSMVGPTGRVHANHRRDELGEHLDQGNLLCIPQGLLRLGARCAYWYPNVSIEIRRASRLELKPS